MKFLVQVLGGTSIQMVIGALWYGPLNGELFTKLAFPNGKIPKELNHHLCLAMTALCAYGLNNLMKLFVDALDVYSVMGGLVVGVSLWAFGLFLQLPHVFYEHRSLVLTLVHELGHLVELLLLAVYYAYMASLTPK